VLGVVVILNILRRCALKEGGSNRYRSLPGHEIFDYITGCRIQIPVTITNTLTFPARAPDDRETGTIIGGNARSQRSHRNYWPIRLHCKIEEMKCCLRWQHDNHTRTRNYYWQERKTPQNHISNYWPTVKLHPEAKK
jgi:hypothetical protein